jgi:hypothetical protein
MKISRDTLHDNVLIIEEPQKESKEEEEKRKERYGKNRMKNFSNYNE